MWIVLSCRRGSRILQGLVSNPSERAPEVERPPPIILTHITGTKQFFGLRINSWRQAVVRHPLLSSCSSCFVFTKHPVQLKTVTTNDMFSKYVLFKKWHLNKRAGVWTPWTPPGSATVPQRHRQHVLPIIVLNSGNMNLDAESNQL